MLLTDFYVHGFKRFGGEDEHRLRVDRRVVCLIGANEAGKSSLLQAMHDSQLNSAVPSAVRSRLERIDDKHIISRLRFRLGPDDIRAVEEFYGPRDEPPQWFDISRDASGSLTQHVDHEPTRDTSHRERANALLESENLIDRLVAAPVDGDGEITGDAAWELNSPETCRQILSSTAQTLPQDDLNFLEDLAEAASNIGEGVLADTLREVVATELSGHPRQEVIRTLWRRTPNFVTFSDAERRLESQYDLSSFEDDFSFPRALRNLLRLAQVDVTEVLRAVDSEETASIPLYESRANSRLKQIFSVWSREPPVTVSLRFNGPLLEIHARTADDVPMQITERSDGLREFVALVAATQQWDTTAPPILLIDEVETHLHYDAQAALVDLLTQQTGSDAAIGQVIYTTHSAACLPEDLGSVRVVRGHAAPPRSTIQNAFWHDEPGLGPLLMAMGSATLAFVPQRAAVIGEGPSEVILLPSILKDAMGTERLGFHVAPGGSTVRPGAVIGFDLQATKTVWIVDGDAGGASIAKKLNTDGIPTDRIISIAPTESGVTLEDLINPHTYAAAIAGYFRDIGTSVEPPSVETLGKTGRSRRLAEYCEEHGVAPPGKVAVANKLTFDWVPGTLVAAEWQNTVRTLYGEITSKLATEGPSS
ncbi:AAA family ATPase [Patulibacter sp. S7RM1-6]